MAIDFKYEQKLKKKYGYKIIVGLDEVGRGPLAGPVTAGAFVWLRAPHEESHEIPHEIKFLKDSKLLSSKKREELYNYFCKLKEEGMVDFATSSVFPSTIDKKHIHHALVLAMQRAVKNLKIVPTHAVIDRFSYKKQILTQTPYILVPKADNLVPCVAAASIVAKVKRDKSMREYYHKKYPEYGFDLHKGYGTKLHYKMLSRYGASPIHRKSFRLK